MAFSRNFANHKLADSRSRLQWRLDFTVSCAFLPFLPGFGVVLQFPTSPPDHFLPGETENMCVAVSKFHLPNHFVWASDICHISHFTGAAFDFRPKFKSDPFEAKHRGWRAPAPYWPPSSAMSATPWPGTRSRQDAATSSGRSLFCVAAPMHRNRWPRFLAVGPDHLPHGTLENRRLTGIPLDQSTTDRLSSYLARFSFYSRM